MTAKMDNARALAAVDEAIRVTDRATGWMDELKAARDYLRTRLAAPASHDAELPTPALVFDAVNHGVSFADGVEILSRTADFYSAEQMRAALSAQQQATPKGEGSDYYWGKPAFKNFHRSLCARFGYAHDEEFWWRDQVSLEEHIAAQTAPKPEAVGALAGEGDIVRRLRKVIAGGSDEWPEAAGLWPLLHDCLHALSAAPVAAQQPAVVGDGHLATLRKLRYEEAGLVEDYPVPCASRDEEIEIVAALDAAIAALTPAATPVPVGGEGCPAGCEKWAEHSGHVCQHPWHTAQQGPVVGEAMVAIKSAIAELDALRNAMFKTYAAAANGADKAKLIRLIEAERDAYEAHYSLPKLQAALAARPELALAHPPQDGRKGEGRG